MTNIELGLGLKGVPAEIPNCGRDELPQFFLDMGFTVGAEIGVYKGDFLLKFAKVGLKMYGIDPWRISPEFKHDRGQGRLDEQFDHTTRLLAPYPNCTIVRKTSMEAVEDFEDGSLDFVYIDGHHGFKYVAEDLWEWSKKVKKGGIISGHDYASVHDARDRYTYHVKHAVDGFVRAKQIPNFWILGERKPKNDEFRDKWRSWMWINP